MRPFEFHFPVAFASALLGAVLVFSGCNHLGHPDERMAVYNALDQHDLRSVTVSQDRGAGTITLSGIVGSNDSRQRAEQVAQQSAPGYQIVDRLQIDTTGIQSDIQSSTRKAQLDSAIEDHFRSTISAHPSLKSQKIQAIAYHGTLTLKGSVKTVQERKQAEDLAKKVPQVQHVVNQLQVQPGKPSPANS
ncbi:MAG TPA: BON domain-containing protein [Terracidiphilus sp.]|jgi:hyperosmotically inducible protein